MRLRKILPALLCLFLVLILLAPTAIMALGVGEGEGGGDYGRPGSSHNQKLNSADILERYLGEELHSAEYDYLAEHGSLSLSFDRGVSGSLSSITYYETERQLEVRARPYKYTATSGTLVVWTPTVATLGEREQGLVLTDGEYCTLFEEALADEDTRVEIIYSISFEISEESINELLSMAYENAPILLTKRDKHIADTEAYEDYLIRISEYESDYALYTEYLTQKKIYDDARREYEAYISAYEKYELDLAEYERYQEALLEYNAAYAAYTQYLSDLDVYNRELKAYEEYLESYPENIELARYHISILDMMMVRMTDQKRTLYAAIMGAMVDKVLENKSAFSGPQYGVPEEVVYAAGDATERLREIIVPYFEIKDEEAKYAYYVLNYEAFRDNLTLLLQSLDNMYRNKRVRSNLNAYGGEGMTDKYMILLSQLYLISNALNDGPVCSFYYNDPSANAEDKYVFDSSYTMPVVGSRDTLTPYQVLGGGAEDFLADLECAEPLADGYPEVVDEPTLPEEKLEPTPPDKVNKPIEPDAVPHPGDEPEFVARPEKPEEVLPPGDNELDPLSLALIELYESGGITSRPSNVGGYTITETVTVSKRVGSGDTIKHVSVTFYDEDGTLLEVQTLESGDLVDYTGGLLTKPEDATATYSFDGWVDERGERVDLTSVTSDLKLYACYAKTPKKYAVTFDDGLEKRTDYVEYGCMPEYGVKDPERPEDKTFIYEFIGWDKEFLPVTEDVTYTAKYSKTYIVPFVQGQGAESVVATDDYYVVDGTGGFGVSYDLSELIRRSLNGEARGIVLETAQGNITMSYTTLAEMAKNGHTVVEISVVISYGGNGNYRFELSVNDGTPENSGEYRFDVSLYCLMDVGSKTKLTRPDPEGNKQYTNYEMTGNYIRFNCVSGSVYTLADEYSVNLIPSDFANVTVSPGDMSEGEEVEIHATVADGVKLVEIYLITSDGEKITVSGESFIMPDSDVRIVVVTEKIKYKVVFEDGGKVLSSKTYEWGAEIVLPRDPIKGSDGAYSYKFVGWSPEVSDTVTGDVTYTAVYEATLLPPKERPSGLVLETKYKRLLIVGIVCVCVVILVIIPGLVFGTVCLVKRIRKLKKAEANRKI